jgi:hypothetical protein
MCVQIMLFPAWDGADSQGKVQVSLLDLMRFKIDDPASAGRIKKAA